MLRIAICDDEVIEANKAAAILQEFLDRQHREYELLVENDGEELLTKCREKKWVPNVVFMDIELGEKSGIDIVKELNKELPKCFIIYLSNYISYALDVYSTEHQYFVIKSQLTERLESIFKKIKQINEDNGERISIILKYNQMVNFWLEDICCLERKGRKTFVRTESETYESYQSLDEMMPLLSEDFVRCHNSYIINMKKVINYKREQIIIQPYMEIPISRHYQPMVKERYMNWSRENLLL